MQWDWYQFTAETTPDHVIGELLAGLDLAALEDCPPQPPYERGVAIVRGDRRLAACYWGGCNPEPHVRATGSGEPNEVAALIRRLGIPHRVTRADACEDFEAPDAWDRLADLWLQAADDHRVKVRHVGDFHRAEDGRTLYLGSPSSIVQARCYEKGKELGIDRPIARAEVQCRPKKQARYAAASMEPHEVWGLSRWSRDLGQHLTGLDIPRVPAGTLYRPTDTDRARSALLRQYGATLCAWADELGSPEALGVELIKRLST